MLRGDAITSGRRTNPYIRTLSQNLIGTCRVKEQSIYTILLLNRLLIRDCGLFARNLHFRLIKLGKSRNLLRKLAFNVDSLSRSHVYLHCHEQNAAV